MTEYIKGLRTRFITNAEHKQYRQPPMDPYGLAKEWSLQAMGDTARGVARLQAVLQAEIPQVWHDEKIALMRTVPVLPELYTTQEMDAISTKYTIHEQGKVCNISPEYTLLLNKGFQQRSEEINVQLAQLGGEDHEKRTFLLSLLDTMEEIQRFADRYRTQAESVGNQLVADTLSVVPAHPPETFQQALQFMRILHYSLWASFNYHNTLGRFDQYMYPYYKADMEAGRLNDVSALELLEEFFLSCNKDSDLYTGMQQGDNGQSIVLGGYDALGNDMYNELSELCMTACEELRLIDPKINLRVNHSTPVERYVRGSKLTKLGLGFPQYSNDDVVVPCLLHWGYAPEHAYNYAVAACWEFIIPGYGMDIPNLNGLSFSAAVRQAMTKLEDCTNFDDLMAEMKRAIYAQAKALMDGVGEIYMEPAPLMSLLMQGCVENTTDISQRGYYNNYGFHGTGLSTAADSLAAVQKFVFEEKRFTPKAILEMVERNFEGFETEDNILRYEAPKMGNDDDGVDDIATQLLDWFADAVEGVQNPKGGIWRAGTGSAMYYIWHASDDVATPDGRRQGEPLACNYSPSLFSRCNGPISIIKSFSKPNLERVANGGPLTIELHDTIFRNEESITKVAMFVKSFMDMGGHQMQINAVNRDVMQDAKEHPENHKNLIVRVWGWSGYFVELDEVYQNHIMERMELTF